MTRDPDIQSGVTGVSREESQDIWEGCFEEPVDHGTCAVLGAPLLQLLDIGIKPKVNLITDDIYKPWAIYGTFVTDGPSGNLVMYRASPDNPEKISKIDPGGVFYLTLPDHGPISGFFPEFHAKVELMDKIRNCVLIKKPFVLNYNKEHKYDTVQYEDIEDENATLCVKYITYRAAVTATVEVVLRKKVDRDRDRPVYVEPKKEQSLDRTDVVGVEGTLMASNHYTKNHFLAHSHGGIDCTCVRLVTLPKDSSKVTLGTSVPLSRTMQAVPVYSLFLIDIDLMVSGYGRVRNVVEFCADDCGYPVQYVEVPSGLICQLKVRWAHVCWEFPNFMKTEEATSQENESNSIAKKMKVDDPNASSSTFTLYNIPMGLEFVGERHMQVFSVSLGLQKDEFCNVYGTIKVSDVLDEHLIYDKDESCPEKITCDRTLSLRGPGDHCVAGSNYFLKVDLKVGSQKFCKGYICWAGFRLQRNWFDEHLCAVIKGDSGYAAVHHAIFSSAVQAKVKIFFISSSGRAIVTGKVLVEYSEYAYDTVFESEYHRTALFSKTQGSPAMLVSGDEQPMPLSTKYKGRSSDDREGDTLDLLKETGIPLLLSRSLVSVPSDGSLILDVKLAATVETQGSKSEDVEFSGRAEFIIGREMCYVIESQGHQLCIFVDWDTVTMRPRPKK